MTPVNERGEAPLLDGPLRFLFEAALFLRIVAALLVEWVARRQGVVCLFPDTDIYWALAETIRAGAPYEVMQWGVPHRALRTPGYPLFLAAFGGVPLLARLGQAALGALSVVLLAGLARRALPSADRRAVWVAAALLAFDPLSIGMSGLLLSEALYAPLLLAALWGLAAAWDGRGRWGRASLAAGAALGAGVMVRPSAVPLIPALLLGWLAFAPRRRAALAGCLLAAMAAAAVMGPWWARNAAIYGRFVPTALWGGASLYDGLREGADGGSDMAFLNEPGIWSLDELDQDAELTRRARAFIREHPAEAARLALAKLGRFLSPWPNAEALSHPAPAAGFALATIPAYLLILAGAWRCRWSPRALILLLGPLLATAALHLLFVGSIRYRVPAMAPAFALAAWAIRDRVPILRARPPG